ncbi:hypothetical protein DRJ17_04875 [Candidatus Woesearchaeota archaeon]|nr:MAG: hypothetical protein DRJ17_04875 [Candidatus Woesearchaeota archaeon]
MKSKKNRLLKQLKLLRKQYDAGIITHSEYIRRKLNVENKLMKREAGYGLTEEDIKHLQKYGVIKTPKQIEAQAKLVDAIISKFKRRKSKIKVAKQLAKQPDVLRRLYLKKKLACGELPKKPTRKISRISFLDLAKNIFSSKTKQKKTVKKKVETYGKSSVRELILEKQVAKKQIKAKKISLRYKQRKPKKETSVSLFDRSIQNVIQKSMQEKEKKLRSEIKKLSKEDLHRFIATRKTKKKEEALQTGPKTDLLAKIANSTIERLSLSFIKKSPKTFEQLYQNYKLSGIGYLFNTYVNIMVFCTVVVFIFATAFSVTLFYLRYDPLYLFILKGFFAGALSAAITFILFYLYPSSRAKVRTRSIDTNLPFAIDHMSAVARSGVPPISILRLFAETKEYGQVSIEIRKIVTLVDNLGYDLETAVKTVASKTPSQHMRDFLIGLINTIDTGGDLNKYLSLKSADLRSVYNLTRQKFIETISLYSDVYTGVMMTAPLLFVVMFVLVSLLGGKVGPFNVRNLIAISIYLIVPVVNFAFLLYLEFTQPGQ